MYYKMNILDINGEETEHIFIKLENDVVISFPNIEENMGEERIIYLEWLEEGNTPLPWPPSEV